MGEWFNSYTHMIEYYLATKINELLLQVTTWINLKCILLNERSQLNNLHVYKTFCEKQNYKDRKQMQDRGKS